MPRATPARHTGEARTRGRECHHDVVADPGDSRRPAGLPVGADGEPRAAGGQHPRRAGAHHRGGRGRRLPGRRAGRARRGRPARRRRRVVGAGTLRGAREARGLADQPTRALGAGRPAGARPGRDWARRCGPCSRADVSAGDPRRPAPAAGRRGRMLLADPAGGSFALRRAAPASPRPSTRGPRPLSSWPRRGAPGRRAGHAAAARRRGAGRPAGRRRRPAGVGELHEACSARSRQRRYLGGAALPQPARLRRLLEPAGG